MTYYLLGFREVDASVVIDLWTISAHPASLPAVARMLGQRAAAKYVLYADRSPDPEAIRLALDTGPAALLALPGMLGLIEVDTGRTVKPREISEIPDTEWN